MAQRAKTSGRTNIITFSLLRDRLTSRNRRVALPALVSLVLRYLEQNRKVTKIGISELDETSIGDFSMMASWNAHGRYLRVDNKSELLFSGYWQSHGHYYVMTWRRRPSWEGALYDQIRMKFIAR